MMADSFKDSSFKDIPSIKKLHDDNYRRWSILIERILDAKGV
jgi:hypothetical protein